MRKRRKFGQILRKIRKECGFSQESLALEANLNRVFIGRLERDEMIPTLKTLFAISDAVKVPASQIIARMER